MYSSIGFVIFFVGSVVADYPQRQAPYHTGPNEPYSEFINSNYIQEPSQRLFWGSQGSNQVGGSGLWAHLTNKFPFLGNMFGRMELPSEYGVPNQYNNVPNQYNNVPNQYNVPSTQYGAPGYNQVPYYPQQQQQFYQRGQQFYQQVPQRFAPSGREFQVTDDAVIVTNPFLPPVAQPAPVPVPAPAPSPIPTPEPAQGYSYNKPQYRLELPHK